MANVPQSTLKWLYDVLSQLNYRDPNRAYSDIAQTIGQYPGLPPRSSVYTSESGSSALLVNLSGTLPVNFRGTVYKFPLTIWFPQPYPYEAPLVYVTPTEEMVVRQGQHVSGADGKVYHHYLANWVHAPDRSSVIELLAILTDIFTREPPVVAKPRDIIGQRPSRPGLSGPSQGPPPVPVNPQAQSRQQQARPTSQYGGPHPPPPPPKQLTGQSPRSESTSSPPPPAPKPGRYDAPPPLPLQDQSQSSRPQSIHANGNVQPPGGMNYMPQRQSYQSPSGQQQPHQLHAQQAHSSSPSPLQQSHRQSVQSGAPSPYQAQTYHSPLPSQHQPPQQYVPQPGHQPFRQTSFPQQHQPIVQQQPKQPQRDLLSEEDPFQLSLPTTQANIPAPSISPNPEKEALLSHISHQILQHLHQSIDQTNTAAIPSLQAQNMALQTAQANLTSEINQLQTLSSHLTSNITALTQTLNQANTTIASTRDKAHPSNPSNIPSIDEIIIPPSVIARQLYDNVSEQRGYESAIYALNEAFVRGRVGSEVWSRKVRECAREEFRRKWMVRKIGEGLGLEGMN